MRMSTAVLLFASLGVELAQVPNPTQKDRALTPADTGQPMPVFRVTVVSRSIPAINYHHRAGMTKIDFKGTELAPQAKGEAKVESRMGSTKVETSIERLEPAGKYGPEFLTYVLWAVTPEGRADNLGELVLEGNKAKLLSTTELQAFGLIVTAEPYFAVTQPSDVVVVENFIRTDTTGTFQPIAAKYDLLQRGAYTLKRTHAALKPIDPKGPLQLMEAQNAVQIARMLGAETYAADTMQKALQQLRNAEGYMRGVKNPLRKPLETTARESTQMAEDARIITIKKIQQEELNNERRAAAEREAKAKAETEAEVQRRAEAEARRATAEAERAAAEQASPGRGTKQAGGR